MAPHSSTLAWKIYPMDGGAWQAAVHGISKSRTRLSDFTFTLHFHVLEKENGNPLQGSCLENPRDGGARWAAVYGVAQKRTRLKRLSSGVGALVIISKIIIIIILQVQSFQIEWETLHVRPGCKLCKGNYHLRVPKIQTALVFSQKTSQIPEQRESWRER